ncbi:uncharacterized protein ACA1_117010 [Acanthamoeba castellanii str. Neff]|uniref:DUF488 domain-containing protein n=1 Tax=Acanthamoeba castellanii (strain ATCC 30010 / Neff) TaxID=1257118 RepID=L8H657_ACACF|nr:uncharacterized protein ACA1_117010 [Acanthamoeba castellanii str. Neff]ELR20228.1 hypothetical protein ACA1_117010 [Acanthamoeba castellanii str. Neff]
MQKGSWGGGGTASGRGRGGGGRGAGEVIYTVGYGGLKSTDAFVERLKANGITRLLDIRISPHCGFNRDFTGRAMGVLLRKQGIAYEHFMELGNVWRSEGSEPELDAAIRLRLYRELMTTAGELLTRRLRQRVQAAPHERICILCACGDVRECHRNIVATYLHDTHHYTIRHI